jgi:hypothetical protein
MVDETAYRQALRFANLQSCTFGKAVLARCCSCSLVEKHSIAERESIVCAQASARVNCQLLHQLLRHNSIFALKHIHEDDLLTHAQEMKLQCGGLTGLQNAMNVNGANEKEPVTDVVSLVNAALRIFGALETLPYSQIVQSVASHKIRQRRKTE